MGPPPLSEEVADTAEVSMDNAMGTLRARLAAVDELVARQEASPYAQRDHAGSGSSGSGSGSGSSGSGSGNRHHRPGTPPGADDDEAARADTVGKEAAAAGQRGRDASTLDEGEVAGGPILAPELALIMRRKAEAEKEIAAAQAARAGFGASSPAALAIRSPGAAAKRLGRYTGSLFSRGRRAGTPSSVATQPSLAAVAAVAEDGGVSGAGDYAADYSGGGDNAHDDGGGDLSPTERLRRDKCLAHGLPLASSWEDPF
jgi:hypothetical protein